MNSGSFAGVFVFDVVHIDFFIKIKFQLSVFAQIKDFFLALAGNKKIFGVGNSCVIAFIQHLVRMVAVEDGGRNIVDGFSVDFKSVFNAGYICKVGS